MDKVFQKKKKRQLKSKLIFFIPNHNDTNMKQQNGKKEQNKKNRLKQEQVMYVRTYVVTLMNANT